MHINVINLTQCSRHCKYRRYENLNLVLWVNDLIKEAIFSSHHSDNSACSVHLSSLHLIWLSSNLPILYKYLLSLFFSITFHSLISILRQSNDLISCKNLYLCVVNKLWWKCSAVVSFMIGKLDKKSSSKWCCLQVDNCKQPNSALKTYLYLD